VAALLVNSDGRLLVAERRDFRDSWQFPQGGIDEGESARTALVRELGEELSLQSGHFVIQDQRGGYRYEFPLKHRRKGRYVGQEQTYFRCLFTGCDEDLNLETEHPEFGRWKWIRPGEFRAAWLPEFKRDVYRSVLRDFFQVEMVGG
jgi:putative (di)nucleoside polyphosphate hydrolase